MLTGHASIEAAMNAVKGGEIYRFSSKPRDNIQLKLSIRSAMEKFNLEEKSSSSYELTTDFFFRYFISSDTAATDIGFAWHIL